MNTETMIKEMIAMQDQLNKQTIGDDWRKKNLNWSRAIWIECAELMDHYGWKWWKHQECNINQCKMELVDIWHFGLSQLIIEKLNINNIVTRIRMGHHVLDSSFLDSVEKIAENALANVFYTSIFTSAILKIGMDLPELYKLYMTKNALNKLRQDRGYMDGSYIKMWDNQEDNEHAFVIAQHLDVEDNFFEKVYSALEDNYQSLTGRK